MIHFVISDSVNTAVNVSRVLGEKDHKQAHRDADKSTQALSAYP